MLSDLAVTVTGTASALAIFTTFTGVVFIDANVGNDGCTEALFVLPNDGVRPLYQFTDPSFARPIVFPEPGETISEFRLSP